MQTEFICLVQTDFEKDFWIAFDKKTPGEYSNGTLQPLHRIHDGMHAESDKYTGGALIFTTHITGKGNPGGSTFKQWNGSIDISMLQ